MAIPKRTEFQIQRLANATITADLPIWRERIRDNDDWREPQYSGEDIRAARKYYVQIEQENIRRATPATGTLAAPLIEVTAPTATTILALYSNTPTNWRMATKIGANAWVGRAVNQHTFSGLTASTEYTVQFRFWNGGTAASPTNTSAIASFTITTPAS